VRYTSKKKTYIYIYIYVCYRLPPTILTDGIAEADLALLAKNGVSVRCAANILAALVAFVDHDVDIDSLGEALPWPHVEGWSMPNAASIAAMSFTVKPHQQSPFAMVHVPWLPGMKRNGPLAGPWGHSPKGLPKRKTKNNYPNK
jgi:hypothetical protein